METKYTDENADFVFRFELEPVDFSDAEDPLTEFIRRQLEDLLGLLSFTCNGEEIDVDGFILDNRRDTIVRIRKPKDVEEMKHRESGGSRFK